MTVLLYFLPAVPVLIRSLLALTRISGATSLTNTSNKKLLSMKWVHQPCPTKSILGFLNQQKVRSTRAMQSTSVLCRSFKFHGFSAIFLITELLEESELHLPILFLD